MPINSCVKGKVGEREVAELLRSHGFEAKRGQQHAGGNDSPDVKHNIPGVHIEVKRVENFNVYKALDQAMGDKKDDEFPVVFHRRSRRDWVVCLPAEDFLRLVKDQRA